MQDKLDDRDYPAYTMGLAADLLGVQPAFLRSLDAVGLLTPGRSAGGQRRYSRADLTLATRVRGLLDQNMPLAAAIRIVSLEHQLVAAHRRIADLEQSTGQPPVTPAVNEAERATK
ncbi:MAG: MerR family transcriptional regulator [Pseudonocardiales bacterium]|nr:MerR family transcriptional regulator [Pseudonocardiales bacterium]MBV9029222.1 MerR family transcriptional regulator [Pseudonocardiales bacterium]MBW0011479.1 MerR family transcriptional regulator [Pseudonocardiales bacterium]